MPSIQVEGGQLVYNTAGSSHMPPVMLVHGWTSHRGVWQQTMAELAPKYYCISPDLMGFGDSDKPAAGDYSIAAQGRRILALADALHLDTFSLVGHSMGGQICMMIAGQLAPERIQKLVSVAGVVTGTLSAYVRYLIYPGVALTAHFPLLQRLVAALIHYPPYARLNFGSWFYRMELLPFDAWEEDRCRAVQPDGHIATHRAGQAIARTGLVPLLPAITAPALVIHGVQDGTVPVEDAWLFRQHIPGSEIVLLEECGHFPMYEKFSDYIRALQRFLSLPAGKSS